MDATPPIIVRRKKKGEHGHHGGAWKIAYADFMTAMMAFFLLMWLLSSSSDAQLEGIAQYFKDPTSVVSRQGQNLSSSASLIPGGGDDLTRKEGEVSAAKVIEDLVEQTELDTQDDRDEAAQMRALEEALQEIIEVDPRLQAFKNQIYIDLTAEGLRIQIIDDKKRPMFDLSSDRLHDYAADVLKALAPIMNGVRNRLSLSGHTDAHMYAGGEGGFSNWELSANRANASRRALIEGGLSPAKIGRVVGLADSIPFQSMDPMADANRRISIIVMNKKTDEALKKMSEIEANEAVLLQE